MDKKQAKPRGWRRKLLGFAGYLLMALIIITAVDIYRWPDSRGLAHAQLVRLDGQAVDLQKTDAPVFVYFWASWCGICRHTSPQLQALHRAGYPVLGMAVQSGSEADVRAYMAEHGLDFPVVHDGDGRLHEAFDIVAVPTIALVHKGKIRVATSGWTSAWGLRARYYLLRWFSP